MFGLRVKAVAAAVAGATGWTGAGVAVTVCWRQGLRKIMRRNTAIISLGNCVPLQLNDEQSYGDCELRAPKLRNMEDGVVEFVFISSCRDTAPAPVLRVNVDEIVFLVPGNDGKSLGCLLELSTNCEQGRIYNSLKVFKFRENVSSCSEIHLRKQSIRNSFRKTVWMYMLDYSCDYAGFTSAGCFILTIK